SGTALSTGLKILFNRPRPDLGAAATVFTASFPSGHATLSAVVFLTLGALLADSIQRPALKVYFIALSIVLAVIVGISRIYLGVHYPTDVIAGWALGGAWALLCWVGWRALPR
ncbi:MAG: Membrane-associated phospholipid phosphatase, partial [Devosia sp.]|uniref:phosphatase PAP2 family protein n=1 Tax=Devosia sp. TaxID=1871048 RepID=UPI0026053DB3